jgi:hypothetical protein
MATCRRAAAADGGERACLKRLERGIERIAYAFWRLAG